MDSTFPFDQKQVACICEAMLQQNNPINLRHLLTSTPTTWWLSSPNAPISNVQQTLWKAQAQLAFADANYGLVLRILTEYSFDTSHQPELQQLWFQTHYAQAEQEKGRPLTPVDKYRLRRRFTLPATIWDGEETVYCFRQSVRELLLRYYEQDRYPRTVAKYAMARHTGLTITQVSNWFKNHRQRDKTVKTGTNCSLSNSPRNYYPSTSTLSNDSCHTNQPTHPTNYETQSHFSPEWTEPIKHGLQISESYDGGVLTNSCSINPCNAPVSNQSTLDHWASRELVPSQSDSNNPYCSMWPQFDTSRWLESVPMNHEQTVCLPCGESYEQQNYALHSCSTDSVPSQRIINSGAMYVEMNHGNLVQ